MIDIDIDMHIERIYKNPYESEGQSIEACSICDTRILAEDDYYWIDGRAYCLGCVGEGKRLG